MKKLPFDIGSRPLNPDFGNGIFRRRLRLQGESDRVVAEVEDCNHGFRSIVYHDGEQVTRIETQAIRTPFSTCDGAMSLIQGFVGVNIHDGLKEITRGFNPKSNCTHLYDLTVLAIQHCHRGENTRQFDIAVPDEYDGPTEATITLNQNILLRWQVSQWVLQNPEFKGVSLARGFGEWASSYYQGDERDAAFILQKGYLVSNARKFDMGKLQGTLISDYEHMLGACYTYTPGVVENAYRTMSNTRDFTHTEEQLLQFK